MSDEPIKPNNEPVKPHKAPITSEDEGYVKPEMVVKNFAKTYETPHKMHTRNSLQPVVEFLDAVVFSVSFARTHTRQLIKVRLVWCRLSVRCREPSSLVPLT